MHVEAKTAILIDRDTGFNIFFIAKEIESVNRLKLHRIAT
jgi:hypothetical protein